MNHLTKTRLLIVLSFALPFLPVQIAHTISTVRDPKPQGYAQNPKPPEPAQKDQRGVGVQAASPSPTPDQAGTIQAKSGAAKPEIVLQAGITAPQSQISFSPDGSLLASMGISGNAIKLWEVASGRLVRQMESSIPSMGASSKSRPFRFSVDGKTLIAFADGRLQRWDVETGRELKNTLLTTAKDLFFAFLSEDASTLAALNMNNAAVRLWDANGGRELRSLILEEDEHMGGQNALALSADGKLMAALTEKVKGSMKGMETKRQVAIWEVASGRKLRTLNIKSTNAGFTTVHQPGAVPTANLTFASGTGGTAEDVWLAVREEGSMKIWDVASGRELKTFRSPPLRKQSDPNLEMFASKFLFSANRQMLSMVSSGGKIDLIDTASTNTLRTFAGHNGNVVGVSFSADGKLFASSGSDNQIKLWDVATGREVKTLSGAAMPVSDIAFSEDGRSLALAGQQAVTSWELATGGVRRAVMLPDDYARVGMEAMIERGTLLSPDGKMMVAGSNSQPVVKIWELSTGRELPNVSLTQGKELKNATFNRDGSTLALVEAENQKPGSATTQPTAAQTPAALPSPTPKIAGMPDMSKMPKGIPDMSKMPDMAGMPDISKMMEMMKKDPKKMEAELKKAQEAMNKGDLGAGMEMMEQMGMMPATNKNKPGNSLRIIEVSSGRQLQTIALPGGFMNDTSSMMSSSALSFSPDGRILASASGFSAPLVLRDAGTGEELRRLKSLGSMSVSTLAWNPDSKRLASSHWGFKRNMMDPKLAENFSFEDMGFSVKVWDAQTGAELTTLAGHNNFVNRLAFSRDGRLLASGGYDSTIKLWDLASGRELQTLKGHSGSITAIDFSPDGRFVISGSDDGSARLWTTQTGELLATLVSINKGADWLVVTPDGLFDGSPGGWNQILWRFTPNIFDVSPVEIFFNEYFHPGLLPDILAGKKLAVAVDISKKDRRQPRLNLEIADAGGGSAPALTARTSKVKINITDAPAGARDLRLFRNGSLVKVWRGDVLQGQASASLETTVSIVAGPNQFVAYAFNSDNVKSSDATLSFNGADNLTRAATLHLLVVGVNEYANPAYNLKYATADARVFAEEMEREQRKLGRYQQIEITSLLDQNATKANLLYALKRLGGAADARPAAGAPAELEQIKAAEPEDAVVVYFAGHGTAQEQRFYLIPHDLGYLGKRTELDGTGLSSMLSHSISDLELEQAFERIDGGLMLMVIDACNSGQALETEEKRRGPMNSKGLAQLAYEKGMYILTAAQSYQAALEAAQLGHGYLTYALVEEGLKATAADNQPKDGQVVLREWLDFATERVPQMQETKMRMARGLNVAIAFVEGEEKVADVDKRTLQRPRVFYRREQEAQPLVVAKP